MQLSPRRTGWIEVICGPMFSGKTEELIRRLRRAQIAKQRVAIFKPEIDNRYSVDEIVSHGGSRVPSIVARDPWEIWDKAQGYEVVGIDEGQFFGLELVEVCDRLASLGLRVVVSGLDQDYRGRPFEPIPQLLAVAEFITKSLAICVVCGDPASRSQRTISKESRVVVGAAESYEARCRRCFVAPDGQDRQKTLPLRSTDYLPGSEVARQGNS